MAALQASLIRPQHQLAIKQRNGFALKVVAADFALLSVQLKPFTWFCLSKCSCVTSRHKKSTSWVPDMLTNSEKILKLTS
ncbi:hypothetical protein ACT3TQ_12970 [Halomonas sp. AOP12-C2-37]|uniref:hypothetical protein n=1 Tax=Halomonas sp. AOP12-C2-37 TaxID=3457722 RepID=UPI004033DDD6